MFPKRKKGTLKLSATYFKKVMLKYGFCKKSLRKDEPLTDLSEVTSYKIHILGGRWFSKILLDI